MNSNENYEQKNLLIKSLIKRIKKNNLKEVIIATSATVEGQTTAHYIEDTIKNDKIKITKLAWETKGVREVKNAITIKGNSNFNLTA